MYKKIVNRGEKNYTYYYANVREGKKVKNIFLSSDKREAIQLEKELKKNNISRENILHSAPQPKERYSGANTIFLFLGILLVAGLFFYFFNTITGFTVLEDSGIELPVDKHVGLDSNVFLTVGLNEYSKPLSDFDYEIVDDTYYVDELKVNVGDFVNLEPGTHTIFLSLIDNGELVAIKSQDITIKNEIGEEIIVENTTEEPEVVLINETENETELEPVVTIIEEPIEETIIEINETEVVNETIEEINISEYVIYEDELENDTLQYNLTLQKNVAIENLTGLELIEPIRINSPVKWKKRAKANEGEISITVDIPEVANNIVVKKIVNEEGIEINDKVKVVDKGSVKDLESTNLITGGVTFDFLNWFEGITGFAVAGKKDIILEEETISLIIEDTDLNEVEVEYETEGPRTIKEKDVGKGVEIKLSSDIYYENVISYTVLKDYNGESILVVDLNNGNNVGVYNTYNSDEGYVVEWIVDHFSERNYGVYLGSVYLASGFVSTVNPEFNSSASWINIDSNLNHRDFTVARTNNTLYCNYANTTESNLEYKWYKDNITLTGETSSSLSSNNFMKGDLIFCGINGTNSTTRYIIDTILGDFNNGTFSSNGTAYEINWTRQYGNLTLNNISSVNGYFSKGNYTSDIFELGENPNATEISFGYDIPHSAYYFQDDLIFAWDGSQANAYNNASIIGTLVGGLIPGNDGNVSNKYIIDKNSTQFFVGQQILYGDYTYWNQITEKMTLSFWARNLQSTSEDVQSIVGRYRTTGDNRVWRMIHDNSDNLEVQIHDGGGGTGSNTTVVTTPANFLKDVMQEWNHYAFTVNSTSLVIYFNGEYAVDGDASNLHGIYHDGISAMAISARDGNTGNYWNGSVDEIHVWNRDLSADEINLLYNMSKYGALKLQTRTGNYWNISNITGINRVAETDEINWSYWSTSYYTTNGTIHRIINLTEPYRYIQYRTLFETLDTNVTPVLTDTVIKQEDYKLRVLGSQPESNFSLFYPYNATWTGLNNTFFNLTNISWLDWGYRDVIGDDDLIGYWNFEENYNGTNSTSTLGGWCDSSGGTCPINVTGKVRNGLNFNGDDDYLEIGDLDMYSFGDGVNDHAFSVGIWIKVIDIPSGSHRGIVSKDVGGSDREWYLILTSSTSVIGIKVFDSGNNQQGIYSTTSLNENEWYYIIGTYDGRGGSAAYEGMDIYINGVKEQDVTIASSDVGYTAMSNTGGSVMLGTFNGLNNLINATLDEMTLWNRELDAEEVSKLYDKGRLKFQLQVDNNSDYSSPEINLNSTEWEWNQTKQLYDGNYSARVRLIWDGNITDDVYENQYTDWIDTWEFYVDATHPNITFINQTINRTEGQVFVNETSAIITGENITLRFNLTDTGIGVINSAWIKIWDNVKGGTLLFLGWLTNILGNLWEITTTANYTYSPGQVNYTIYVNDTLNNTFDYDGNFYVEYDTTLDAFFNYTNMIYGENITLIVNYNYTNNSAIKNAVINVTISDYNYSLTYDDNAEYYYNSTIGNYDLEVGEYVVSVNASYNNTYYQFGNNLTLLNVYSELPIRSVWQYPSSGDKMLYDNYTEFNWRDSFGHNSKETINYELEVYNNTAFSSDYLVFAFNSTYSNYTLLEDNMPPVGDYYIRYRANDSFGYNSYNYTNFSVAYATLNITFPYNNQILKRSTDYWFNVTELGNSDWVNNISLEISGSTFINYFNLTANSSQFAYTSYGGSYSVPAVVSQFVTITAYGWNGSIGSSSNTSATQVFRIKNGATTSPTIDYFCPRVTYNTQEQVNITVRTSMEDILFDTINVSILTPSEGTIILNETENDIYNYIDNDYSFEHNFTYTPSENGDYVLRVEVKDINYDDTLLIVNDTTPLYVTDETNIQFTSSGISNFTVRDICSNQIIEDTNASLSISEVPGQYNLEFVEEYLNVVLSNVTLDGDEGEICSYNDIDETIVPPTDTRAVDQFNLTCNPEFGWNETFDSVNITYNYSNIIQRITHEENLDAYKCSSVADCTWNDLTYLLSSDTNEIEFSSNNFSIFMVSEDVTVTTVTVTTAGAGGGGGGGGAGTTGATVDLDIIEAGTLTFGDEYVMDTIVTIVNPWNQPLYGIQLSANSEEPNLEFTFDEDYIYSLPPGGRMPVTLTVKRLKEVGEGTYDVNIVASVVSPEFFDKSKLVVTSLGAGGIRSEARRQLEFVEKLFLQNPACKELYELVKKAKVSFEEDDYEASMRLAEGAVNACEKLLTSLGLKIQKPSSKALSDNLILGIEIVVFLFLFYAIYYYYRRRRFKKKKI